MAEALTRIDASDQLKEMLKVPMFRLTDTVRNQDSSERKPKAPQYYCDQLALAFMA